MNWQKVNFITSAAASEQFPADDGAEVAFAGRSNAGKSTALNALTGQSRLARTSKTPGRTQLINFFSDESVERLVDLPGYGFAKAPPQAKAAWDRLVECYLSERRSLRALVLLMDCRHPLKDTDCAVLEWAFVSQLPVCAVLTKADKLKYGRQQQVRREVEARLEGTQSVIYLFSAVSGLGVDALRRQIEYHLTVK